MKLCLEAWQHYSRLPRLAQRSAREIETRPSPPLDISLSLQDARAVVCDRVLLCGLVEVVVIRRNSREGSPSYYPRYRIKVSTERHSWSFLSRMRDSELGRSMLSYSSEIVVKANTCLRLDLSNYEVTGISYAKTDRTPRFFDPIFYSPHNRHKKSLYLQLNTQPPLRT